MRDSTSERGTVVPIGVVIACRTIDVGLDAPHVRGRRSCGWWRRERRPGRWRGTAGRRGRRGWGVNPEPDSGQPAVVTRSQAVKAKDWPILHEVDGAY